MVSGFYYCWTIFLASGFFIFSVKSTMGRKMRFWIWNCRKQSKIMYKITYEVKIAVYHSTRSIFIIMSISYWKSFIKLFFCVMITVKSKSGASVSK